MFKMSVNCNDSVVCDRWLFFCTQKTCYFRGITVNQSEIWYFGGWTYLLAVWFSLTKTKTKMMKNEKITNSLTKTKTKTKKMMKTKTKLKRKNRKRLKTKTKKLKTKTKMKMPKQQNLSLNESASIQYGAYGCYGCTALNPWLTVDGI